MGNWVNCKQAVDPETEECVKVKPDLGNWVNCKVVSEFKPGATKVKPDLGNWVNCKIA